MANGSASRSRRRRQRETAVREVAKIVEAEYAVDGTQVRGQLDDPDAMGESERSWMGTGADVFETGDGARFEEPQQGGRVEGLSADQAKLDDSGRPGAGTVRSSRISLGVKSKTSLIVSLN